MPAVTNLWTKVKMENCTAWKSGSGKKVFTKSRHEPSKGKGGGKGRTDRECFRCGRIGHIRADCKSQKSRQWRDSQNLRRKEKSVGNCEDKETETSQNVSLGTIDVGVF